MNLLAEMCDVGPVSGIQSLADIQSLVVEISRNGGRIVGPQNVAELIRSLLEEIRETSNSENEKNKARQLASRLPNSDHWLLIPSNRPCNIRLADTLSLDLSSNQSFEYLCSQRGPLGIPICGRGSSVSRVTVDELTAMAIIPFHLCCELSIADRYIGGKDRGKVEVIFRFIKSLLVRAKNQDLSGVTLFTTGGSSTCDDWKVRMRGAFSMVFGNGIRFAIKEIRLPSRGTHDRYLFFKIGKCNGTWREFSVQFHSGFDRIVSPTELIDCKVSMDINCADGLLHAFESQSC